MQLQLSMTYRWVCGVGPRRYRVHLGVGRGSETRNIVIFQVEINSKARFLDVGVPSETGFWSVI